MSSEDMKAMIIFKIDPNIINTKIDPIPITYILYFN